MPSNWQPQTPECCWPSFSCALLLQFVREFAKLGLTRSVGGVLALALARELTPVVTAIILAGRVGSAFAAELGTMQVGSAMESSSTFSSSSSSSSSVVSSCSNRMQQW